MLRCQVLQQKLLVPATLTVRELGITSPMNFSSLFCSNVVPTEGLGLGRDGWWRKGEDGRRRLVGRLKEFPTGAPKNRERAYNRTLRAVRHMMRKRKAVSDGLQPAKSWIPAGSGEGGGCGWRKRGEGMFVAG